MSRLPRQPCVCVCSSLPVSVPCPSVFICGVCACVRVFERRGTACPAPALDPFLTPHPPAAQRATSRRSSWVVPSSRAAGIMPSLSLTRSLSHTRTQLARAHTLHSVIAPSRTATPPRLHHPCCRLTHFAHLLPPSPPLLGIWEGIWMWHCPVEVGSDCVKQRLWMSR